MLSGRKSETDPFELASPFSGIPSAGMPIPAWLAVHEVRVVLVAVGRYLHSFLIASRP